MLVNKLYLFFLCAFFARARSGGVSPCYDAILTHHPSVTLTRSSSCVLITLTTMWRHTETEINGLTMVICQYASD